MRHFTRQQGLPGSTGARAGPSARSLPRTPGPAVILACLLSLTLASLALSQEGYEDMGYERINVVDPIDQITAALHRWGRVFLGVGVALLALIGLKLLGPLRIYDSLRDRSLTKSVRGLDELLKRIQAEAEAAREETPNENAEDGLLAGMAEMAEFAAAEAVPSYVLTVNDLMLDNIRTSLKKLRRRREGRAERYREYMFSVLQGIKTITEQSAEAGVSSGLAVDVREYFTDETRYRIWGRLLGRYRRHGKHAEVAQAFLLFMKSVREGRPLIPAAPVVDPGEDTAISAAQPSSPVPEVLNETTLAAIQKAAAEETKELCHLIEQGRRPDGTSTWQHELVRRQEQIHARDEAQKMLSVFLNCERRCLRETTRIQMLPCRTWGHVLYMLGVDSGTQLRDRVTERLLTVQETVIMEKAFLQTFAKRRSLEHVYGHGADADLMIEMHIPEIRRESLAVLRLLHQLEPERLKAATEALNEEETPQNSAVERLIEHYVYHRHDPPSNEQNSSNNPPSARRNQL